MSGDNNFLEAISIIKARNGNGLSLNCSSRCGETCQTPQTSLHREWRVLVSEIVLWEVVHADRARRGTKENQGFCLHFGSEPMFSPYNCFSQDFLWIRPRENCSSILTYSFFSFPYVTFLQNYSINSRIETWIVQVKLGERNSCLSLWEQRRKTPNEEFVFVRYSPT